MSNLIYVILLASLALNSSYARENCQKKEVKVS